MEFTLDSKLGDLLADPEAIKVVDQYLPGASANPLVAMAKNLSLRTIVAMPQAAMLGLTPAKAEEILVEVNKRMPKTQEELQSQINQVAPQVQREVNRVAPGAAEQIQREVGRIVPPTTPPAKK